MKILFLTSAHNSLSQRAFVELVDRGHTVVVVIASSEEVMLEAVEREQPDLILAPMLKKVIPASIWQKYTCIIIQPGIKGDRGPSSLDWAILNGYQEWGVTLLQANAEMDAGDIWASHAFSMKDRSKSHLYRHEVTEAAIKGLLETIAKVEHKAFEPEPLDYSRQEVKGRLQAAMKQVDRAIDWHESTATILRKIRSADSFPGVLDTVLGTPCYLYGAHEDDVLRGIPGTIIGTRHGAICRATGDGAIWITHLKHKSPDGEPSFKLLATQVLGDRLTHVPEIPVAIDFVYHGLTYREIWYEERQEVGYLHFEFYNGAMSTEQCQRLRAAFLRIRRRPTKVIVLNPHYKGMGNLYGSEYWTYLLPKRVGADKARELSAALLPISTRTAHRIGLLDDAFGEDVASFRQHISKLAEELASSHRYEYLLEEKRHGREHDEARKPLQAYGDERFGTGGRVEFATGQVTGWHDDGQPARDESCGRAKMLDGRTMSAEIKAQVRRFVEKQGRAPGLVIVRVEGDAASGVYSKAILRVAEDVGINARLEHLPVSTSDHELRALLVQLNHDRAVHGILVQMPLPAHLSHELVAATIAATKDIDGISPHSAGNLLLGLPGFLPSTAAAVMEMLERTHTPLEGRRVVVISRSNVVGKPLAIMLLQKNATVTICHSRTTNLAALTRQADVLVVATGCAGMVTAEMVKPGAIVIDVGINALADGGIVGDVDVASVREVARAITPVPGGVGPLTNIVLLRQCVQAAWQLGVEEKDVRTAA
jgi:5,10-methylene-tetrahydrofolate dehydrogenase/methenyl tetrahydrofolate cyclohydrolase/methionyl-tRNA formyltransferase